MNKLEPTYLRYVYDSLQKGVLSGENASGLPYGFIGIYEQEFQSSTPIYLRQERLGQLALWALFKGEVRIWYPLFWEYLRSLPKSL